MNSPKPLTYERFRAEMVEALRLDVVDQEMERQIRELWDTAREAGRRAGQIRLEEGA